MDAGWDELERMAHAASASDAQIASQYPAQESIERWMRLFGYSRIDARITDDHWELVRTEKEALGYDREAYEHNLSLLKVFKSQSAFIPTSGADGEMMLLFRLGGLLSSAKKVQEVAGLDRVPVEQEGMSEMGPVKFCLVDKDAQKKLEQWLTQQSVLQQ
ncbi:hypothetical protein J4E91_001346 [Alternaria rosae]|nr:hypothetical protein J4E91_001346 [Alternaria rosae]